jgi:hypothetical protein
MEIPWRLAAQQAGVAALNVVDPKGTSAFQTANVFGTDQTTYHFDGVASPINRVVSR